MEKAFVPEEVVNATMAKSVAKAMQGLTRLQGCQLWNHAKDLSGQSLTKEQASHTAVFRRSVVHMEKNLRVYSSESLSQAHKQNYSVQFP